MSIQVRKGTETDLPAVLELIKELAVFENAPGEVEVTHEQMWEWGFGDNKLFGFFVLEKDTRVIGMALYYYKYSTWKGKCLFLEDIIVTQKERYRGYGKLLFAEVVKVARHEKVKRMEWQVLNWNKPAIHFYKNYQSDFDNEWINCKLTFEQLQAMN